MYVYGLALLCKLILFILKPIENLFSKINRGLHRLIYPPRRIPPSERSLFTTNSNESINENLLIEQYKELNNKLDSLYRRRTITNNTFSTLCLGIVTGIWFIYTTIVTAAAVKFNGLVLLIAAPPAFGVLISIFWLIVNGHYIEQVKEILETIKCFEQKMPAKIIDYQDQAKSFSERYKDDPVPSKRFTYLILPTAFFAIFGIILYSCVIPVNGFFLFFTIVGISLFALFPYLSEDTLSDSIYILYTASFFIVFGVLLVAFNPDVSCNLGVGKQVHKSEHVQDKKHKPLDTKTQESPFEKLTSLGESWRNKLYHMLSPYAKEEKVLQRLFHEVNNAKDPSEIVKAKIARKIHDVATDANVLSKAKTYVETHQDSKDFESAFSATLEESFSKALDTEPSVSKDVSTAINGLKKYVKNSNKSMIDQINSLKDSISENQNSASKIEARDSTQTNSEIED